jgi:hypothetical protein
VRGFSNQNLTDGISLSFTQFIEHLVNVFKKLAQEYNENLKNLEPLIRWLKNKARIHLQALKSQHELERNWERKVHPW